MKKRTLEIEFDGNELVAALQETVELYREDASKNFEPENASL